MWRRAAGAVVGTIAALVAFELFLVPLSSAYQPPTPNVAADSLTSRVVTRRQLEEGIATTRFSSGGSRLTGRAPIAGAPVMVLIGDSYVVAREVADESTMGADLERLAASEGRPVNVRQYGWRAAGASQYILVAPDVIRRWNPGRVVVVLNDDDLDQREGALYAPGWVPPITTWRDRSRVVALARHRGLLLRSRAVSAMDRWKRRFCCHAEPSVVIPSEARDPHVQIPRIARDDNPEAVVADLQKAYGDRLVIAYVATVGMRGGDSSAVLESRLLQACARQRVPCASTRDSMLAMRRRDVIVRGFSTTTLGEGHLNAAGHDVVAHAIWGLVR